MEKIILLALFVTLIGCAQTASSLKDDIATPLLKKNKVSTSSVNTHQSNLQVVQLDKQAINMGKLSPKSQSKTYSVQINQQKFIAEAPTIQQGQALYNVNMRNYGVVKNSFVVICAHQPSWLENDFSIANIAEQTYRLKSKFLSVNLYEWYQLLSEDERFTTVELEIDYSGKTNRPEY